MNYVTSWLHSLLTYAILILIKISRVTTNRKHAKMMCVMRKIQELYSIEIPSKSLITPDLQKISIDPVNSFIAETKFNTTSIESIINFEHCLINVITTPYDC